MTTTSSDPASTIARREFLKASMAAAGCTGLCVPSDDRPRGCGDEALTYAEFLELAVPLAKKLVAHESRPGEDHYLLSIAALAVRLASVDEPELRRVDKEDEPAHWIGANDTPEDCPFTVLHWKLAPNAVVRPHPHTYGSVVTLGLEGEVRVANHETVDAPDYEGDGRFLLRRTNDQILRPHDVNVVALRHGFIHGFVAGQEGARGLDITTRVRAKQPNLSVDIGGQPVDAARALFHGRWIR